MTEREEQLARLADQAIEEMSKTAERIITLADEEDQSELRELIAYKQGII
jgi:hypothetical protein